MVSLRFPFWFSPPSKLPHHGPSRSPPPRPSSPSPTVCSIVAAAGVAAAAAGYTVTQRNKIEEHPAFVDALNLLFSNIIPHSRSLPMWGSLSLADTPSSPVVVESKTGASFPAVLGDSLRLLGIGLRKKSVFGLKNIDVYAFGVYADDSDLKKSVGEKYGKLPIPGLNGKQLLEDLIEDDICVTVRLQIAYSRLSIRSVRNAFEESVGNRLQKFGGSDNKELLQRFTSQFKDEYKIPQGSVINLSKEKGHVLRTMIGGKEVGSIPSKLLCRSILDLYIGEDPFDEQAKDNIQLKLASLLQK